MKHPIEIGQKFGRWTVLEIGVKNPYSKAKHPPNCAKVQCECGKIQYKEYRDLYDGRSLSCGCLRNEQIKQWNKEKGDIPVGTRFGHLTVIKDGGYIIQPSGRTVRRQLCKCDCGNILFVLNNNLKSGGSQSCGCVQSRGERIIAQILRENKINFKQQVSFNDLRGPKGGLLKFDFGIYDGENLCELIEFDGRQHFQEADGIWNSKETLATRKTNDKLKDLYCEKNNIPLMRIPYYDIGKLDAEYLKLI